MGEFTGMTQEAAPAPEPPEPSAIRAGPKIDKRTAAGRRREDLIAFYTKVIGDRMTPALALKVERAADLKVLAEIARRRLLAGQGTVTWDDLVRVERLAEQAEKALPLIAGRKPACGGRQPSEKYRMVDGKLVPEDPLRTTYMRKISIG